MKKFPIIAAILLVFALLTTSVMAADFTPSAEKKDSPVLTGTPDETGKIVVGAILEANGDVYRPIYIDELIVTPISYLEREEKNVPDAIRDTLVAAREELASRALEDLLPGFAAEWQKLTAGAPVENAEISDIFDVRFSDELNGILTEGRSATFSLKFEDLEANDLCLFIHKKNGAQNWNIESHTAAAGGVVKFHVDSLSPFALVKDSGAAPAISPDAPSSPQTGVELPGILLPVAAVVLLGAAAFAVIRRRSVKTKA